MMQTFTPKTYIHCTCGRSRDIEGHRTTQAG